MAEPKKITELWAWICTEADGGDGIPASGAILPGVLMPLVGADKERMKSLDRHARDIARATGCPIRLERFHGPGLMRKLASLALRLAEEAEIATKAASDHEKSGDRDKAYRELGKGEGLAHASRELQALVRGES